MDEHVESLYDSFHVVIVQRLCRCSAVIDNSNDNTTTISFAIVVAVVTAVAAVAFFTVV